MPTVEAVIKRFGRKAHNFITRPIASEKKYNLLEGSVRSSKTFAVDSKIISQLSWYKLPLNAKRIMTGATKQTFYRNVLLDLFTIAGKENYSYNSASGELWLFGKQWFVIGAKDEAAYKQILGSTVGLWVGDEVVEYPQSFIAQMFMRMSPPGARAYLTTNPGNPYQYLKTDVIDNPEFASRLEVLHFMLHDNPNISPEDKADIVASQKGVFKLRYIEGLWVVAEGSIYRDSWDEAENCYSLEGRFNERGDVWYKPRKPGLRGDGGYMERWFACDAGVDHPQVYGEFYDDGDTVYLERVWRWDSREHMRQLTDAQYADELIKFMGKDGESCMVLVPPEAASLQAEFRHRNLWVVDADNEVSEGIHTVSTMLSKRMLQINVDCCEGMEKRIPNYAWNEKKAKLGLEEPLKVKDDDVDMLRYGVHGKIPHYRIYGGGL